MNDNGDVRVASGEWQTTQYVLPHRLLVTATGIAVSISRHPTQQEMSALIASGLEDCSPQARSAFSAHLIDLQPKTLKWEYGNSEEFPSWVFADMKERGVYAAYCTGGHGALGSPWGLVFLHDDYFGMDSGWFRSLHDLLTDWGLGNDI